MHSGHWSSGNLVEKPDHDGFICESVWGSMLTYYYKYSKSTFIFTRYFYTQHISRLLISPVTCS